MKQSLGLRQGQGLMLYHAQFKESGYAAYAREALKAFRKFIYEGEVFYTCNVARLKACNRLGDDKEVTLWRTHFFLSSPHFNDVSGAIFSDRPGYELAEITRGQEIDYVYLALDHRKMVNVRNGYVVELTAPLIFASPAQK